MRAFVVLLAAIAISALTVAPSYGAGPYSTHKRSFFGRGIPYRGGSAYSGQSNTGWSYGAPGNLPRGWNYYNGRYYGNFNNRYYGPQYGYF